VGYVGYVGLKVYGTPSGDPWSLTKHLVNWAVAVPWAEQTDR
jgi:hypothetical protein